MLNQFLKKFREHEWYPLLDFLSPVFFEVVPTWDMIRILTQLTSDSLHSKRQEAFSLSMSQQLRTWELPIGFTQAPSVSQEGLGRGDLLLRLYFAQILSLPQACLDLRSCSFTEENGGLIWNPRHFVWAWSPSFLSSIRSVYHGFYEDQNELFQQGLAQLKLGHAEQLLRAYFGGGDQSAVEFSLKSFRKSFHDIFLSCRDQGVRLPSEFLPFGLYLVTLYEHLESLGGTFDVRSAYLWAKRQNTEKQVPRP